MVDFDGFSPSTQIHAARAGWETAITANTAKTCRSRNRNEAALNLILDLDSTEIFPIPPLRIDHFGGAIAPRQERAWQST
jgi:hypothetical protein